MNYVGGNGQDRGIRTEREANESVMWIRSLLHQQLENVFQCELHDARISGSRNLTEQVVVENGRRIHHVETVRDVERFGAELNGLGLTKFHGSGKREIELP